jgi:hypothetical protein
MTIGDPPLSTQAVHCNPSLEPVLVFGISMIAPTLLGKPAALNETEFEGCPSIGLRPVR